MVGATNTERWLETFQHGHTPEHIGALLDENVVLFSPVLYRPQHGKFIVTAYLLAASQTIANDTFKYVRIFDCGSKAVLEFETEMDGLYVNGVDMIEWNDAGLITEFKVMVRPMKGLHAVQHLMNEALEAMKNANL